MAQRVWAIPVKPARWALSTCFSRSATREVLRERCSLPSICSGDAAGVVAAIFKPLEAFQQDRSDIALRNRADDAAHGNLSTFVCECTHRRVIALKYVVEIYIYLNYSFIYVIL